MKMWIKLVVVLVLVAGLAIFTGAGVGYLAPGEEVKLVIVGRDGPYGEAMQLAVDTYMSENPNVDIELLKLPWSGLREKVVIDFREAIGAYDLVVLDDPWAPEFMSMGWLQDLEALGLSLDPDFVDKAVAVGRYPYPDGKLYALPHVGNVELFAYRKDIFEKHGIPHPPETWAHVLGAAAIIAAKEPDVHGIVFRGVKGNPIVTGFLPIFWSFGAKVLDVEKHEPLVYSPEAIAALELFLNLKKYAPVGVELYNSSELKETLLVGDVAMAIEIWPAWVPDLDNPEKSKVVGKVEIIAAPGLMAKPAPMIGVWLLGIPAASKNKPAALDFLQFVTSARIQRLMCMEAGLPPTRESLYKDTEIVGRYRWYPGQLEALKTSRPRPRVAEWAEIGPKFGDYLHLALVGELTPEEALSEIHAEIAEILGR